MSESNSIYIVYQTTNLVNQKIYVGVHKQDFYFPVLFEGYLGSGVVLRSAVKKYGRENFVRETLFVFYNSKDAYLKEAEIVDEGFVARNDTYNICVGGGDYSRGMSGKKHTKEWKENHSKKMMGNNNPMFGKNHTIDVKMIISEKNSGRKLSEETRKNMSKNKKGIIIAKDIHGSYFQINKNDDRYLNGEFVGYASGMVNVKDSNGNTFQVSKNDPKFVSGEYVHVRKGIRNTKHKKIKCRFCNKEKSFGWIDKHEKYCSKNPNKEKREIIECPHCGKIGSNLSAMRRHHFNNCKHKK